MIYKFVGNLNQSRDWAIFVQAYYHKCLNDQTFMSDFCCK